MVYVESSEDGGSGQSAQIHTTGIFNSLQQSLDGRLERVASEKKTNSNNERVVFTPSYQSSRFAPAYTCRQLIKPPFCHGGARVEINRKPARRQACCWLKYVARTYYAVVGRCLRVTGGFGSRKCAMYISIL